MNRALRVIVATGITLGLLVGAGPQALACSCAGGDPRTRLVGAPAAIVGTLERIGPAHADGKSRFHFTIEKAVKGGFGPTLDVVGQAGDGASCGIEVRVGERTGLFLDRSGGEWTAFLCSQVDADMLAAAALPFPRPDGVQPVALVVAVEWGDVRMLALDSSGRTIAYGRGGPVLSEVSVCPGGRLAVGWGGNVRGGDLLVREVTTMRFVAQAHATDNLPETGVAVSELACLEKNARDIAFFATEGWPAPRGEITVVRDLRVVRRYTGEWKEAFFHAGTAYVSGGSFGHTLSSVDLATGRVRRLATIAKVGEPEEVGQPVVSPDGRWVAAAAIVPSGGHGAKGSRALLVDISPATPKVFSVPLPEYTDGPIAWISRDRFVLASAGSFSLVFDSSLRKLGEFKGWSASRPEVAGSVAYGMAYGALHAARLPAGPVHEVRTFGTTQTLAVALVPGARPASSLGPVVTPPPEEEPVPIAAPPLASRRSATRWLPVVVFVALFVVTPIGVLLLGRRRS